jgi:hypothetical protein
MEKRVSTDRLRSFFLQLARRAFSDLGLFDNRVVDYVADVLTTFTRAEHLYRMRSPSGRRIDSVVQMLARTQARAQGQTDVLRERAFRKYLGDYTLFMSGVFRKQVESTGVLDYYMKEGQQSYWKVSELDLALYRTGFLLFQDLSKNFEYYSGALDYMRQAHFAPHPGDDPFGEFLKQVDGWIKIGISNN